MEDSILISTKKVLGVDADYRAFDLDIITDINSAFSVLNQLGIGPPEGFMIEDDTAVWDDFVVPLPQLSMIKIYIYLKTRMLFDPPTLSYLVENMNQQIREHEWRLSVFREGDIYVPEEPLEGGEYGYRRVPRARWRERDEVGSS